MTPQAQLLSTMMGMLVSYGATPFSSSLLDPQAVPPTGGLQVSEGAEESVVRCGVSSHAVISTLAGPTRHTCRSTSWINRTLTHRRGTLYLAQFCTLCARKVGARDVAWRCVACCPQTHGRSRHQRERYVSLAERVGTPRRQTRRAGR